MGPSLHDWQEPTYHFAWIRSISCGVESWKISSRTIFDAGTSSGLANQTCDSRLSHSVVSPSFGREKRSQLTLNPAGWCNLLCTIDHNSVCHRNPSYRHTTRRYLVRSGRRLSRWQCPSSSTWLLIIQFTFPSHSHFHDSNPNEIAVLAHVPLSGHRAGRKFCKCFL